jgi:hypothetical protein
MMDNTDPIIETTISDDSALYEKKTASLLNNDNTIQKKLKEVIGAKENVMRNKMVIIIPCFRCLPA